jgi:hypothetical protein
VRNLPIFQSSNLSIFQSFNLSIFRSFWITFGVISTNYVKYLLITLAVYACSPAQAQKQLVLLRHQKVIMRFNPGDQFLISVKGEKQKIDSYINNLFDTAVMLHRTIVPIHKIDRIYFHQSGIVNLVGKFLVVGGAAYFLIDQFNVVVVNGDKANLDKDVTAVSATMVAVGLPMMLIRKNAQRVRGKYRLLVIQKGSPFYLEPINNGAPDP